jgi:hypothetical protein
MEAWLSLPKFQRSAGFQAEICQKSRPTAGSPNLSNAQWDCGEKCCCRNQEIPACNASMEQLQA